MRSSSRDPNANPEAHLLSHRGSQRSLALDDSIASPLVAALRRHVAELICSQQSRAGNTEKRRTRDITCAVKAGLDLVTLAAMLGHSKINMVLPYAHVHEFGSNWVVEGRNGVTFTAPT